MSTGKQNQDGDILKKENIPNKRNSASAKFESVDKNKVLAVEQAMKQIKSAYGEGSIMFFGDAATNEKVKVISTGSLLLDKALGIHGVPRGRITEIYGHEGSGKTTLALHIIANAQKNGEICAFIDVEHALDVSYAKKIGVNLDDLIISQPDNGENALEIVDKLTRSGAVAVIVVDSVAALMPQAELEGNIEDHAMGGQARLMSKSLRRFVSILSKTETALIFINQVRMKIGVMFGSPETTTGGHALKFYASVRLEIKKRALLRKQDIIGHEMEVEVKKNKFSSPFKKVTFELIYGLGINNIGELIDLCVAQEIIQKNGAWFSYGEKRLGQGKDYVVKALQDDQDLYNILLEKISN